MGLKGFLKELHRRRVYGVAVAYVATAAVLLEVLTHLFHNFDAPHWVLKVVTTLLILGLPVACLMAWGFEFKEGVVRSTPRVPKESKPALLALETTAAPSIAVLPFEDMSPEQDQKYLGNGIAEELLNALAGIEELKVAARTSSFSLASRGASMTEIGDTLHVRHVLEGSVRRSGQKLRVTAQLIDVESGFHLYSQSYDRQVQDIFDIQNDIAHEIAGALLPKLGLSRDVMLVRQGTSNLEAYNLRLKARQWLINPDPKTLNVAIAQLEHAIRLDRTYADAWGDLAWVYAYTSTWAADPTAPLMKASNAAAVALANSPENGMALLIPALMSMLVERDAETARSYYERARAAGVDQSFCAFSKAYLLDGPLGHYDEAIAELREAQKRDPLAPNVQWALVDMCVASGRIAEAVASAEALQALAATAPEAPVVSALAFLAAGDVQRARSMAAQLDNIEFGVYQGSPFLKFVIDAATGDLADARRVLDDLLQQSAGGRPVTFWSLGEGYKALGDFERALDAWERAAERREVYSLSRMPLDNRNHPVIGKDPRFLALLRRMGLESRQAAIGQPN